MRVVTGDDALPHHGVSVAGFRECNNLVNAMVPHASCAESERRKLSTEAFRTSCVAQTGSFTMGRSIDQVSQHDNLARRTSGVTSPSRQKIAP
eukprot:11692140-Karenia_brevis.AAC.1